ncbi:hypothetical protein BKA69DRAFT_1124377 [Paraphysoderma sedebokerense]|nr:hypothetical protein BKA69DRAFT_1124377 [Paraphysoderma sedebokerense]
MTMDPYANDTSTQFHFDADSPPNLSDEIDVLEEKGPQSVDYYAVLNLPKDATDEQIKDAYRKLCRTFHPDKVTSNELKEIAQKRFVVIQRAYEVLSDPAKRTAYDLYGPEFQIVLTGKEVGPLLKSPEQIREEYEAKIREQQLLKLESLIRQKGELSVHFNASKLFNPHQDVRIPQTASKTFVTNFRELWNGMELSHMVLRYSTETPILETTSLVLTGHMVTRSGTQAGSGNGNVVATVRHRLKNGVMSEACNDKIYIFERRSDGIVRIPFTILGLSVVVIDTTLPFGCNTLHRSGGVQSTITTLRHPPPFSLMIARRVSKHLPYFGIIRFNTGHYSLPFWQAPTPLSRSRDGTFMLDASSFSSLAVGLQRSTEKGGWHAEVQTSSITNQGVVSWEKVYGETGVKLHGGLSGGGISGGWGITRKLDENTKVEMALELGGGLNLKFSLTRLGQKLNLPILLSSHLSPSLLIWSSIIPLSLYQVINQLLLKPYKRRLLSEKLESLRTTHAELLRQQKRDALDAQKVMFDNVRRKIETEGKKGLVIVKAVYGNLKNPANKTNENGESFIENVIDVSIPVMALVNDSALHIPTGTSKSSILGFYDPCLGEPKQLRITYLFKGKYHRIEVDEFTGVAAPLRSHILVDPPSSEIEPSDSLHPKSQ